MGGEPSKGLILTAVMNFKTTKTSLPDLGRDIREVCNALSSRKLGTLVVFLLLLLLAVITILSRFLQGRDTNGGKETRPK